LGWTAAALLAASLVVLLSSSAFAAHKPLGALTQLTGKTGCFTFNGASEDGANTCASARGMAEAESAQVSPDGANVYVGSYASGTLGAGWAVFKRNQKTGALKQLSGKAGCFTTDGSSVAGAATCTKARGLLNSAGDGHDIAFTSNGKWVYLAANGSPAALLIFKRNVSTGALTQLPGAAGCISTNGSSQDGAATCQTDAHLLDASGLTFSSDERFLYVTGTGGSSQIEVYSHNKKTGALTDIECISQAPAPSGCSTGRVVGDTQAIALAPNGKYAYAGQYQYGMSIFNRNPTTGLLTQKSGTAGCITNDGKDDTGASTCASARVARATFPLLITPNGKWLYNLDGHIGFSTFQINSDGTLSQLAGTDGCMTINGKDNTGASTCATGLGVEAPYGGVLSPDGRNLYLSNDANEGGVAVFLLGRSSGRAIQLAGLNGCISTDGTSAGTAGKCVNGRALKWGYGMDVSPDGRNVYQATDSPTNAGLAVYRRQILPLKLTSLHISGHVGKLLISFKLSAAGFVRIKFSHNGHVLSGGLVEKGKPGKNLFRFSGKVGGHLLGTGTYQATATPVGGAPRKTTFTIKP
jgi:6-phosphogluconolactonase (cycloisomerase 2 family)